MQQTPNYCNALNEENIVKSGKQARCQKCEEMIPKELYKYKSESGYSICLLCAKKEIKQMLKEINRRTTKDYEIKLKAYTLLRNFE